MDAKLARLIAEINKKHGAGTVINGADIHSERVPRITSGSLSLDVILGGGWPANQWQEIIGHESSGKTAVVLKTIAANQALDPDWQAWWLGAEPFDPDYADMCGVDRKRLFLHDTNVMEEGLSSILKVAEARSVDCVVIDSYPALVPMQEDEKEPGEMSPGRGALLLNQFFRKQGSATRRSLVSVDKPITGFLINQWREMIGVTHGDPRTTPGGKGKNFASVTRVEMRRGGMIKDGDEPVGQEIHMKTIKNKSHRPQRMCMVPFYFSDYDGHTAGSYDTAAEVANVALAYGVIQQTPGSGWYYYGDEKWNGIANVQAILHAHPDLAAKMSAEVMAIINHARPVLVAKPPKKIKVPA